jgi:hypothetical protein
MLSQDDRRRLAQLERALRTEDPEFVARMVGMTVPRRRVPLALPLACALIWTGAVALALIGWWPVAVLAAVWAAVISGALIYRCRPSRAAGPELPPRTW